MKPKELNLLDLSKSDWAYHFIKFNDGEEQLVLEELDPKAEYIHILSRIANTNDLYLLLQACDIVRRVGLHYSLVITYLMAQRMDRVMSLDRPYSLKIVADIINNLNAEQVFIVEPHSLKSNLEIKNSITLTPVESYFAKGDIDLSEVQVVLPDAGAVNRYADWFSSHSPIPVVSCEKDRDEATGQITGIKISNPEDIVDKPKVIFDDLIDGGRTFCEIAKLFTCKKTLVVTHAVNKAGIEAVAAVYDEVRITTSYRNWEGEIELPNVKIRDINDMIL